MKSFSLESLNDFWGSITQKVLLSISISPHFLSQGVFPPLPIITLLHFSVPPCNPNIQTNGLHPTVPSAISQIPSAAQKSHVQSLNYSCPGHLKASHVTLRRQNLFKLLPQATKPNTRTSLHFLQEQYNPLVKLEFHMPCWEHNSIFPSLTQSWWVPSSLAVINHF